MKIPVGDIVVEVMQEDIDKGEPVSAENCPLALALRRQIPDSMVEVCEDYTDERIGFIDIYLGDWLKTWKPSKVVYKFVKDFDEGKSVKPHKFCLKGGTQKYITYKDLDCDVSLEFTEEELTEMYGLGK